MKGKWEECQIKLVHDVDNNEAMARIWPAPIFCQIFNISAVAGHDENVISGSSSDFQPSRPQDSPTNRPQRSKYVNLRRLKG